MLKILKQLSYKQVFGICAVFFLCFIVSAFVLEYGFGAQPCRMCWWQRYTHWALFLISIFGVLYSKKHVLLVLTIIATSLVSWCVALWQGLGQIGVVELPNFCHGSGGNMYAAGESLLESLKQGTITVAPACDEVGFTILSLSLAWWNFIIMSCVLVSFAVWLRIKEK